MVESSIALQCVFAEHYATLRNALRLYRHSMI